MYLVKQIPKNRDKVLSRLTLILDLMPRVLTRGIEYRKSCVQIDIDTKVLLNVIVLMPCGLTRGIEYR